LKERENELFGMDMTMTAKTRKPKQSTLAIRVHERVTNIDPTLLTKRKLPAESMHVNIRLTGESVQIYRYLEALTPAITDSLRIRDCIRIAAFLWAMKQKDEPLTLEVDGRQEDLLDYIGAFYPQSPMDTRRRAER